MTQSLPHVIIHTDGGCLGNPGVGGWAAVLESAGKRKEISGGEAATTNNRMELRAAIESLKALKKPCVVEMHTDSQYVRNGITKWLHGWKLKGWKTAAKQPVKNADLWRALDEQASRHTIRWLWVKGHSGVDENERCDQLAAEAMKNIRSQFTREELAKALEAFTADGSDDGGLRL
jgi:ribonuclease HI